MMELIRYRDAGMSTYTYFWVNEAKRCASPFFNSEQEAKEWYEETYLRSVGDSQ